MVKLSVFSCTYNRPLLLGELIHSFEIQTLPLENRELIILDDAGQYGDLRGDGWQVVSFPRRIASLGEKRNICATLASPDATHLVMSDDDDIYLPWWLECHAKNFERGARWSFAAGAYWSENNRITGRWRYQDDTYQMHPNHAYEKELFRESGGYPPLSGWEDLRFQQKLLRMGAAHADSLDGQQPFLIYRRFSSQRHLTGVPVESYQKDYTDRLPSATLEVGWQRDYLQDVRDYEEAQKEA